MTDSARPSPDLLPDEILGHVAKAPCLHHFIPSSKEKPLAVLIPGGAHTARIFYGGHAGCRDSDFLAFWLSKQGFSVLSISYPVESSPELIPPTAPGFGVRQWGRQAAEIAKMVIDKEGLGKDVVLVGWSMGGRIVVPFCNAAKELSLDVKLFVSLSATPALPGARPSPRGVRCSKKGYATFLGMASLFHTQLKEQEGLNDGHVIIPEDIYCTQYFGNTPVGLLGWGFKYPTRPRAASDFVVDTWGHVAEAAAHESSALPWIACLYPTSQADARHALVDKASWGYMLTQKVTEDVMRRSGGQKHWRWKDIVSLVHGAPERLAAEIEGNHFFFVGEKGARETADAIGRFLGVRMEIGQELDRLIDENSY